jgi:putative transcriptional regulator
MTLSMSDHRPTHHPDDGVLLDFASGAAHEGAAVLIATHLALCPQCRETAKRFERLGGALIEDLPPSALAPGSREAVMARLDEPPLARSAPAPARVAQPPHESPIPRPLRDYLDADLDALAWRRLGPTVRQVELPLGGAARERMRLMRIKAGSAIPRHSHDGTEMVLVLDGGFRDGSRQFLRGDFSLSDQQVDHSPRVDPEADCLCLSVTDAPLRFTGPVGRLLNLFVRF